MTDFQKKWAERRDKWEQHEKKRTGDIYDACVKLGCDPSFLKAFDTRIWQYPIQQTEAFIERRDGSRLKQWKIYLQVILEKRPKHEKADEWKKALNMLG